MKVYFGMRQSLYALKKDVLSRGYNHVLVVSIPKEKPLDEILEKLSKAYSQHLKPHQRTRAKQKGEAVFRVVVCTSRRLALIAGTAGTHRYFFSNPNRKDIRRSAVEFGEYDIKRTNQNVQININEQTYQATWNNIKRIILSSSKETLTQLLDNLDWFDSREIRLQKNEYIKYINKERKRHRKEMLPTYKVAPQKRLIKPCQKKPRNEQRLRLEEAEEKLHQAKQELRQAKRELDRGRGKKKSSK